MVAEEVAAYAEAQGYTSVYRYDLPDAPDILIAVLPYGAGGVEHDYGSAAVKREVPRLQFTVRGEPNDAAEPAARAYALFKVIGGISVPTVIGGVKYRELLMLQPPFPIGKDAKKRYQFVFNVEFTKEMSP